MKGGAQGVNRVCMKADAIADTCEAPGEDAIVIIIFDTGRVALVGHGIGHGVTPIRSRNARAART